MIISRTNFLEQPHTTDFLKPGFMMEDGNMRGAAPECAGLGWVYFNGHCYLFDR